MGGAESGREMGVGGRQLTTARCAAAVRDYGPATVAETSRVTGFSRPTVEAAIAVLVGRGLAREAGPRDVVRRGAGRPARRYRFVGEAGIVLGLDVGPHAIKIAVADLAGNVIGHDDVAVDGPYSGPERMDAVTRVIRDTLDYAGLSTELLLAISVAAPGWIASDGRLIVSRNLPDWEGIDIADHLGAEFHCSVSVDNDMRFAALAEHQLGAARLADDVIYLFAGHRLSMALILGGEIRRGHHGAAGEVGDIIFSRHVDGSGELRWSSGETGEQVFRRAADGDRAARTEVGKFVDGLATGLAITAMAVDPDLIVIGGGLSGAGDVLLEPLRRAVCDVITLPIRPKVVASEFGTESAVLGAAAHACKATTAILFGVEGVDGPTITVGAERVGSLPVALDG